MEGLGKGDGVGIAFFGQFVDLRTARIGIAHDAGDLVESFAGGIVAGLAHESERIIAIDLDQLGMAAGYDEGQERRFQIGMAEEVGKDMAFHVVDADQGLIGSKADSLGRCDADQQGPDQAGTVSDADMVDICQGDASRIKGFLDDGHDVFDVLARRDFRYDAAEFPVDRHLCRYDVGADVAAIFEDSSRRFVTTRF